MVYFADQIIANNMLIIMRILAFSDTHGYLPNLDLTGIDRLMIAGDITPPELVTEAEQRPWLEYVFCPWIEALDIPTYLVLGNHDCVGDFRAPPNMRYETAGIVEDVLLFSGTPKYAGWAWEEDERTLAEYLQVILESKKKTPPIWLTHSPPWGVCDGPANLPGYHSGSRALLAALKACQPRLLVCGHIHAGAGCGRIDQTEIYNVSIPDRDNPWDGLPVIIEI